MKTSNVSSNGLPLILEIGFTVFILSLILSSRPAVAQTVYSQGISFSSYAIDLNGNLYTWGFDNYSHTASAGNYLTPPTGSIEVDSTPVKVSFPTGVTKWIAVAAGQIHTLALGNDGNLYAWGNNTFGQLGDGSMSSSSIPILVPKPSGVTSWTAVTAGGFHSLAIGNDGKVYAWGHNNVGQIGDGTSGIDRVSPVKISLPNGVTAIAVSAGTKSSFALGSDGNLYGWGGNTIGELGNGKATDSYKPVLVTKPSGVTGWTKISTGTYFSVALGNDGNLYSWGQDWNGQLGDGTIKGDTTLPTKVTMPAGVTSWKDIACGGQFALAIGNNDSLYAWGRNIQGQLGVATGNSSAPIPVKVSLPGGISAISIATGYAYSLIFGNDGYAYSWGRNVEGELGINSTESNNNSNSVVITRVQRLLSIPPEAPLLILPANNAVEQPTNLTLKWSKIKSAEGYECQVSMDPSFDKDIVINDSALTDTTDKITGLGNSTQYYWRVCAYNNGELGEFSKVDTFTTIMLPPGMPALIFPPDNAVNQPAIDTLICSKAKGASKYYWQVSTDQNFSTYVVNDSTTDTTYIVNLTGGLEYFWRVKASNSSGVSAFAGPNSFTVMSAPSIAPILLSPKNNSTDESVDSVRLSWNRVLEASGYECQLAITPLFSWIVNSISTTSDTTLEVKYLRQSQKYYWRVRAFNNGGAGAYSKVDSFSTIKLSSNLSARVVGYYPSYKSSSLSIDKIEYNNLTDILVAFGYPDTSGNIEMHGGVPPASLVNTAHPKGVEVLLSLGGGANSFNFPIVTKDSMHRAKFISNIITFLEKNNYDGVDIDWERPSNRTQSSQFVSFIKEMREKFNEIYPGWKISIAVPPQSGGQYFNIASVINYLDWINVMCYDYVGYGNQYAGFESALYPDPDSPDHTGSDSVSIEYWLSQGSVGVPIPKNKLVMGVPFYGDEFSASGLHKKLTTTNYSNVIYSDIVNDISSGWSYYWDDTTQVPYLMSPDNTKFITYEDTNSVMKKSEFVLRQHLGGIMVWEMSQDILNNGKQPLLEAIGRSMGKLTSVNSNPAIIKNYKLYNNYPNPFNPSTTIRFSIPNESLVKLVVYNILGQKVKTLINERLPQGTHEVIFNGSNLSSGVYLYRLISNNFIETKKMIILK